METPAFLQGTFEFEGRGFQTPIPLDPKLAYVVPQNRHARPVYFRAGNSSSEMVCLSLARNGKAMRYCPVGAKSGLDVGFHVIEEAQPGDTLEVLAAAPAGTKAWLVVDVGILES